MSDGWKELDLGDRIYCEVDRLARSGNGIVMFGDHEVNIGPVTEDAEEEEVLLEKGTINFGICLIEKFREDDYLEKHPIGDCDFHYRPRDGSGYKKWIGGNPHPPSGVVFAAEIDRIGRNDVGIIATRTGHDVIVDGVTQDDVDELIEAEMIRTRRAEKISDNVELIDTLPSEDAVEVKESGEIQKSQKSSSVTPPERSSKNRSTSEEQTNSPDSKTSDSLRKEAENDAVEKVTKEKTATTYQTPEYTRSEKIKKYVKDRADGVCEGCNEPAPFRSKTGKPYLHAHHVHELSEGGSDTPETVIALCPNCHYRVHHGEDGEEYNEVLIKRLADIEELSVESIRSQAD